MGYKENKGRTEATCEQCGEHFESIYHHWGLSSTCDNPDAIPHDRFALFSGGNDSLVSTHYCMENDLADCVLHLDTNTGIPENKKFVRDVCDQYDWPLEIYTARMTLEEFAKEWGFPKAASHSWAYQYFKERPLSRAARDSEASHQEMYTGVRRAESDRRMTTIEDEKEQHTWTWYAPIADWSDQDCLDYIEEHDLPESEVVKNVHRSGECYCGAFAHRDMELVDLGAKYPEHAEWLLNTEKEVQREIGEEEDYCWWGSEGVSSDRLQELQEDSDSVPMMCKKCGITFEDGKE
jgi:3'-phosphoadenosine 5'-phosphosulfate sulfotransferase (PAPS reductase)/FAD synthetase